MALQDKTAGFEGGAAGVAGALGPVRLGPSNLGLGTSASGRRSSQGGGPEAVGEGLVSERSGQEARVTGTDAMGREGHVIRPGGHGKAVGLAPGSGIAEGFEGDWCALPHTYMA